MEDVPFNYTRFFILGDDDPQPGEFNKTSIVFATRNRPAALYECLGEFATRGYKPDQDEIASPAQPPLGADFLSGLRRSLA